VCKWPQFDWSPFLKPALTFACLTELEDAYLPFNKSKLCCEGRNCSTNPLGQRNVASSLSRATSTRTMSKPHRTRIIDWLCSTCSRGEYQRRLDSRCLQKLVAKHRLCLLDRWSELVELNVSNPWGAWMPWIVWKYVREEDALIRFLCGKVGTQQYGADLSNGDSCKAWPSEGANRDLQIWMD